jgi:cell division topological specificity factor
MLDLVKGFLSNKEDEVASKDIAKERLQLVLIHDRIGVSREVIESMESELIGVISKYLEIDEEGLDIDLKKRDESMALVANIPVKSLKKIKQREVEAEE